MRICRILPTRNRIDARFAALASLGSLTLQMLSGAGETISCVVAGSVAQRKWTQADPDGGEMTGRELAVEFTDLWQDMKPAEINTMLANNVSYDLLEFFSTYADDFVDLLPKDMDPGELKHQLPNLLIIGYIIRVLEERLK